MENTQLEFWKNIDGYDGNYLISNYGNVISNKYKKPTKLKLIKNNNGYLKVTLYHKGVKKQTMIHKLVSYYFCNLKDKEGYVIDHIDEIKSNNNYKNLQQITNRENVFRSIKNQSSKYVGVGWHKRIKKWYALISIKNKKIHLGYYTDEIKASEAYQNKLKSL